MLQHLISQNKSKIYIKKNNKNKGLNMTMHHAKN